MSLGWQSESALLPSKATPINVDSKSMLSMRAIVYKIEQKQKQKLSSDNNNQDSIYKRKISKINDSNNDENDLYKSGTRSKMETKTNTKMNTKIDCKQQLSSSKYTKNSNDKKNSKNNSEIENIEDEESRNRVTSSLIAKAALYDKIVLGRQNVSQINDYEKDNNNYDNNHSHDKNNINNSNNDSDNTKNDKNTNNDLFHSTIATSGTGPFLINFNEKRKINSTDNIHENNNINENNHENDNGNENYSGNDFYGDNFKKRSSKFDYDFNEKNITGISSSGSSSSGGGSGGNNKVINNFEGNNGSEYNNYDSTDNINNNHSNNNNHNNDSGNYGNNEMTEIIDDFGRTKTVKTDSQEYRNFIQNSRLKNQNQVHLNNSNNYSNNESQNTVFGNTENTENTANKSQWAWSNGISHDVSGASAIGASASGASGLSGVSEWVRDSGIVRGLKSMVEEKVEKEVNKNIISNSYKVKTMYERTLENSSKLFLQEVHEESVNNRNNYIEKEKIGNNHVDDRRELLRLKKLQLKK